MQDLNESPAHYSNDKVNLLLTCQLWASEGHYSTSLSLIFFGSKWLWPAVPTWVHCEAKMESMLGTVPDIQDVKMHLSYQWSAGTCLEAVSMGTVHPAPADFLQWQFDLEFRIYTLLAKDLSSLSLSFWYSTWCHSERGCHSHEHPWGSPLRPTEVDRSTKATAWSLDAGPLLLTTALGFLSCLAVWTLVTSFSARHP